MQAADYRECGRIDRTQRLTIGNAAASCSSGRPGGCGPIMQQWPAERVRNLAFFGFRIRFFVVPDHRHI